MIQRPSFLIPRYRLDLPVEEGEVSPGARIHAKHSCRKITLSDFEATPFDLEPHRRFFSEISIREAGVGQLHGSSNKDLKFREGEAAASSPKH